MTEPTPDQRAAECLALRADGSSALDRVAAAIREAEQRGERRGAAAEREACVQAVRAAVAKLKDRAGVGGLMRLHIRGTIEEAIRARGEG